MNVYVSFPLFKKKKKTQQNKFCMFKHSLSKYSLLYVYITLVLLFSNIFFNENCTNKIYFDHNWVHKSLQNNFDDTSYNIFFTNVSFD